MNYEEARNWLTNVSKKGDRLGLERMAVLVRELGNPPSGLKFVHIAGSNGKGSVMTFLEHTLVLAGYRVGRYLSPAVFRYEERFRVDEADISRQELADLTEVLREACRRMERRGEELPTIFEVETALAFLLFRRHACDVVLLETGMGGETDATNVVTDTILEIFSSISLDHMEFLGDSVEEIASVKAGILKSGSLAVSAPQEPGAAQVLRQAAAKKKIPLVFADPGRLTDVRYGLSEQTFCYRTAGQTYRVRITMPGTWQVFNACVALEAVEALRSLGFALDKGTVLSGFAEAKMEGRFEVIHREPLVILDGAHNPEAAQRLSETLLAYFPALTRKKKKDREQEPHRINGSVQKEGNEAGCEEGLPEKTRSAGNTGKLVFIMGVFADKDYTEEIALMAPLADMIYTVQTKDNPRALPADTLAEAVRPVNPNVSAVGDVARALETALERSGREDVILLFGSLSWLAEAKAYITRSL